MTRYAWLGGLDGREIAVNAGKHHSCREVDEILFLERGLTVVRALDESDQDAFAQVRAAPGTIGLERLDHIHRAYEVHAVTDALFFIVSTDRVRDMVKKASPAHQSLIHAMAQVLGSCIEDRVAMSGSAKVRVARLILSGQDGGVRFSRLPRQLWAEVLGMRPETMSRTLRQLQEDGLLDVGPSRVRVVDSRELQRIVDEGDGA